MAANSTRTYFTGARAFVVFMTYFGFLPLWPVTDDHLSAFIVYLARTLGMSSIKVYLQSVRAWHLASGFDFPPLASRFGVFQALQGVKRFVSREAKPKFALTFDILQELYRFVPNPWTDPLMCSVWTCFLVAYFGMFRKDNVTVKKENAFNPNASLCRNDLLVEERPEGRVLWIRVRKAKNNQYKDRVHYVGLVEVRGSFMCPVTWWERHMRLSPAGPTDPAFSYGPRRTPLTHAVLVHSLKRFLTLAGFDAKLFSGHSFRRGGATDAFRMKAPHDQIQLQGDWLSMAFLVYNEKDDAYRLRLPSMLASAVEQAGVAAWSSLP